MKKEDKQQFAKMMAFLGEYYSREISDGLMDIYWHGLEHYEIDAIREAFNRHMQNADTGQFMPKISDVAKMLGGTSQDAALVAWSKVDRAVRCVGTYADVVFDDSLIHRVLNDMGGWISLGLKGEEEWPFVAKEFETRYRGYKMRNERPKYPAVLIGIANANNRNGGFKIEPPRMIGDESACESVMNSGTDKPLLNFTTARESVVKPTHLRLVEALEK